MNAHQAYKGSITKMEIDFMRKQGLLKLIENINESSKHQSISYQSIVLKLKCKPSIQTLILHDFNQTCMNHRCKKFEEIISLKIIQKVIKKEQLSNSSRKTIVSIECYENSTSNHLFYLLSLIRSVWEEKHKSVGDFKFQDLIESCRLYISQFILDLNDLIEIFEAPLTNQYSRL